MAMREYGWGTMMSDYAFLEDVGRKVSEVGREIVGGGFLHGANAGVGGERGRGGMAIRGRSRGGVTLRSFLVMYVRRSGEAKTIDVRGSTLPR